jgi:malate dehydrogenase
VVKAKDGAGSATLSMAYAGAEFAAKILRAIKGETGITTPTYVNLTSDPSGGEALKKELGKELDYFSAVVELGVSPVPSFVGDLV